MKRHILILLAIFSACIVYYFIILKKNLDVSPQKVSCPMTTQIDIPESPDVSTPIAHKTITITNQITKKMTGYRYFGSTHYPNKFIIKANNIELQVDSSTKISLPGDNTVDITYTYSFAKGLYKGEDTSTYTLDPEQNSFNITFSWKIKPRVQLKSLT